MARQLSQNLMAKLSKGGELYKLMRVIASDKELASEIREGRLTVYYQKGVVLEISEKQIKTFNPGYYKGCVDFFGGKIQKKETIDSKCHIEPVKFDPQDPKPYLVWAKKVIETYHFIKHKNEFIIQQKILKENSSNDSNFFVIDLEYQFKQGNIPIEQRIDATKIDIIAIEKKTKDIVLFELKQGDGAVEGKSGITDHIRKTNTHIGNPIFCNELRNDIVQIITQKIELGILDCGKEIIPQIQKSKIKMGFIFVTYSEQDEKEIVKLMKGNEDILAIWKDFSCELYAHHHPSRN